MDVNDRSRVTDAKRRPLRADAERNRTQILRTAKRSFSHDGLNVSVGEIARRSGVGMATVLRRFPSKQDLIDEVLTAYFDAFLPTIAAALTEKDPWRAFAGPIEQFCATQATDRGLATALAGGLAQTSARVDCESVIAGFDQLASRAKAAGLVRPEIEYEHLMLLLKGNAGVIATSPGQEETASRAYVEFALRAFRCPQSPTSNPAPPAQ